MPSKTPAPLPLLYVVIFLSWSGAWFAMKLQSQDVSPVVSVAVRFLLAAPIALGIAWVQGQSLRFSWRDHVLIAAMGAAMFSTNFVFAYYASQHLTSALVSAVFSLTAGFNLLFTWVFFATRPSPRDILGAAVGSLGLLMLMDNELARTGPGDAPLIGFLLAIGMTVSFSLGNMASVGLRNRGLRMMPATAWAMAWGAGFSTIAALASGQSWVLPMTPQYLGSLAFLIFAGTVTGFLAYSVLIARAGAFKAASLNLIVPTGAFLISSALEDYDWTALSTFGLLLTATGNFLILIKSSRPVGEITARPKSA